MFADIRPERLQLHIAQAELAAGLQRLQLQRALPVELATLRSLGAELQCGVLRGTGVEVQQLQIEVLVVQGNGFGEALVGEGQGALADG